MKEDFLHYLWKYKRIPLIHLQTTDKKGIEILQYGNYLQLAGPDFFNAQIRIDNQLWAGNVEMHVKSSDWYAHRHEQDKNYSNVILHVVWEDDVPVFLNDNQLLPTLVLKDIVAPELYTFYKDLVQNNSFLLCETHISQFPDFEWEFWKGKLLLERIEEKSVRVLSLLESSENDWEAVLYRLLCRNFGLNINGTYFDELARAIPYRIIRKERIEVRNLEALFFGLSTLLDEPNSHYEMDLLRRYDYLTQKYQLTKMLEKPQFFKLRPDNFPTIRIAQFVVLLHTQHNLFEMLIVRQASYSELVSILKVQTTSFWDTHYVFNKESPEKKKRITTSFINLLLINTILPLRFIYQKSKGKDAFDDIERLYRAIAPEKNTIVEKFKKKNVRCDTASDSQALLHLKRNYCEEKKCLKCSVGHYLMSKI